MFRQQEFVFPKLCVNNAVSTMCDYWVNENTISQIIRQMLKVKEVRLKKMIASVRNMEAWLGTWCPSVSEQKKTLTKSS